MGVYASWVQQHAAQPPHPVYRGLRRAVAAAKRLWSGRSKRADKALGWNGDLSFLDAAVRKAKASAQAPLSSPARIMHLIGTLGPGGAERQLCNFVIAARALGHDVRVMLMWQPAGDLAHYYHLLEGARVPVTIAGAMFHPDFPAAIRDVPGGLESVAQIPPECWPVVVDVLGELLVDRPAILHTWLDGSNVWGGIAGLLAQVPQIVMSTRNVNPMHFPTISQHYYQRAYTELLTSPTIHLINNSYAGAKDYAEWLDIAPERVSVVLNGLELSSLNRPTGGEMAAFRSSAHIPADSPVMAGVFRLSEEKQPMAFLDVVRGVVRHRPNLVAVIAGIGPLEPAMREYVNAHQLEPNIRFLGRLADVTPVYCASRLTLLCSRKEGTPNVLLESQWLGCPVVATKAGGAVDVVQDGVTGYLVDVGDIAGLEKAVLRLLCDTELRTRMAAAGPRYVESRFSVTQMVNNTLSLYRTIDERAHAF